MWATLSSQEPDDAIATICTGWWFVAISFYSLKFVSPLFDRLTAYGKHRTDKELPAGSLTRATSFVFFYTSGAVALVTAASFPFWAFPLWADPAAADSLPSIEHIARATFARLADLPVSLAHVMFLVHVVVRVLECLFVHRFTPREKVPLLSVVSGCGFYFFTALSVTAPPSLAAGRPARGKEETAAFLLFFLVMQLVQLAHHALLASVRMRTQPCHLVALVRGALGSGASEAEEAAQRRRVYALPEGLLFDILACPHYTVEILMFAAIVAAAPSPTTLLLFAFVVLNLGATAHRTAAWYQQKFGAKRYALIPYVW